MQPGYPFQGPYPSRLPQASSLHKTFYPPFPSFQQQQQQQYYDPYLRPLKTIKPTTTYKEHYYDHKTLGHTCYPPYEPFHSMMHGGREEDGYTTHRGKKQVESLDRKIQGLNGKKYRSLDYYSDGETQLADEYLYGVNPHRYQFELKEDEGVGGWEDDFAGIKELSRSLSKRKKTSKLLLEQWKFEQKQLSLEKQIERQELQLYILQQQLKLELQQQKQQPNLEQLPSQNHYKPPLHYKHSFPSYFDQLDHDQATSPRFLQHQPYYPPLQFESDAHLPYDVIGSKSRRKQKHKNGDKQQHHKGPFPDPFATPSHRKRYSSDSDIQNGNGNGNYGAVTSSPSTTALQLAPGLLSNGEKSNSLPAEIENGALSSNGDDPTQLKHWLRKLDRLSYDLREFNGRLKSGNNLKGSFGTFMNLKLLGFSISFSL